MHNKIIQDAYPLSPMQSGLLFQSLYAPESDAYFVQSIFELKGEVDVSVLNMAWQKVSDHHPTLRTGFVWQNLETILQYVLESAEVPFVVEDWQTLPEPEQNQKLEVFIKEDRKKGFNLNDAPLFRLTLIQYSVKRYYLIWSQHHTIADGWCLSIILGDVFKAYEALRRGREVQFISRRPYRDYIVWLQAQDLNKAEAFWKDYLASLEEPNRLSFSNIIEENQEKEYDTHSITFSVEETDEMKTFVQQHGLTLNTVIQGAVGLVLKAYTQRQEVVMGVTISGRSIDLSGAEEMVGLFINTLPLKITPYSGEDTLTFLKSLQEQAQKLNDYAYASLAQIQSWSGINQSLFDVLFVFENYPLDEEIYNIASDFIIRDVQGETKTEYPLTIVVEPGRQIYFALSYQTRHFNEEVIKRLVDHIKQVVREILHHSKKIPQAHSLLTQAEEYQLLIEWNDTKADYSADKTIHQLFEEQVKKSPNSIAVVYEDQELTYQQLNERANHVAHHLRDLGVRPDTLVAIAVERSLEMIIGLLGILKAGGAYVPLDPSYPEERLQFMLEDTNAPILITQAHLEDIFRDYSGTTLNLHLEDENKELFIEEKSINIENSEAQRWISPTAESSQNLESLTTPHNLAYVIYTSGSTGKPKGVMIGHSSVCNLLETTHIVTDNCQKTCSLWTNISFDVATYEIFSIFLQGGTLHILNDEVRSEDNKLFRYLEIKSIERSYVPPSMLQKFLIFSRTANLNLKTLVVGVEPIEHTLLLEILENIPNLKIINGYGPTESTIGSTLYSLSNKKLLSKKEKTPIGRPLGNTQIYILNDQLNPVPIGVSGEIYIGGAGLARGYLGRPDLTAERFIPNPFLAVEDTQENLINFNSLQFSSLSSDPRSLRLYRTGDLARYLPDGNIEFFGRIDDQVKIRGFRIELGEIESVLQSHGDVVQAVVLARKYGSDKSDKKLVAYVVLPEERIASLSTESVHTSSAEERFSVLNGANLRNVTEGLRDHLSHSLPDYMVPSFFVYVDKIPLTPNGKVDRKSLPAPDLSLRFVGDEYVAPRNELEEQICQIWAEVLGLIDSKISIHDDFFRIGGDSIISIQLVSKLRQKLRLKNVSVKDIFSYRSIEKLYDNILSKQLLDNTEVEVKTEQGTLSGNVPFLPIQEWFFESKFAAANYWNQSFLLRTPSLDLELLQASIIKLAEQHDSLRLRYKKVKSPEPIPNTSKADYAQYYSLNIEVPRLQTLDIKTLKSKEGTQEFEEELQKILTNWQNAFNVEQGPMYSIGYIHGYRDGSSRIYFALHHLIVDSVSWRILAEDLRDLYNQKDLSSKGSSYRQWVNTVREYAKTHESEKAYWINILGDYDKNNDELAKLIVDEETQSSATLELSEEKTQHLLRESNRAYNTQVNDILLTALGYTLSELTNNKVNHITLEGHGREEIDRSIDITRTVGWFTTMYPVRLAINEEFGKSIRYVKETLRQIPNKGIGYGTLIDYKTNNLPRVSFNYLGQFDQEEKQQSSIQGQSWNIVDESSGESVSIANCDHNIININGLVTAGKLKFNIASKLGCEATAKIAQLFKTSLENVINHCITKTSVEHTMSDFEDFKPYVTFNEEIERNDNKLFIFPPGHGGAESYFNNIALQVIDRNLIIFNNYYVYLKDKFGLNYINHLTFENLASDYIVYIKSIQAKGPYNFLGWSFGGVLAFEVARQLMNEGDIVTDIILIDALFNYREALLNINGQSSKEEDINYKYNSTLNSKMLDANVILFKAVKPVSNNSKINHNNLELEEYKIFEYYATKTKCNNLSYLIENKKFRVIPMEHDHYSWINDNTQILKICDEIRKSHI